MDSFRFRHIVFLSLIALVSNGSFAKNVIKIDDVDALEIRVDGTNKYEYADSSVVPALPIPILQEDSQYLLIKLKDGKHVWISRADVKTDNEPTILNKCHTTIVARKSSQEYGVRGVGENCEK